MVNGVCSYLFSLPLALSFERLFQLSALLLSVHFFVKIESLYNFSRKIYSLVSGQNCRAIFIGVNLSLEFANLFYSASSPCFDHCPDTRSSPADSAQLLSFNWLDSYLQDQFSCRNGQIWKFLHSSYCFLDWMVRLQSAVTSILWLIISPISFQQRHAKLFRLIALG